MRKLSTILFVLIAGITLSFGQQNNIPGLAMVMLNPQEDVKAFTADLNRRHPGANFQISRDVASDWNIWLLSFDNQFISDNDALYMLQRDKAVTLAQFDYPVESRATAPNDPSYNQQWGLKNTGQSGGTVGADVDAELAWDITTGGTTAQGDVIVVAVIDGGFQNNHPDLVDNYWVNTAEIAGNGIDDDGNGYIDNRNGWNAYNNNGNIPSDQHGTHVSGIIGARGNNSAGVSGVNWNVKIMRLAGSSGTTSTVVNAYGYAAKQRKIYNQTNGAQGAFVVATNSSFGIDGANAANFPIWCAFYDTLGVLGIISAGAGPNNNTNIDVAGDIPTTCPSQYMVAVTNTTRTDAKATQAGYGLINMDLGAPGSSIYSTVTGSSYQNLSGTSMATPHVAGAIGLYYAAACSDFITAYKANPAAMALQMRTFLLTGVDSISSMSTTTASKGRLNLYKGIQRVQAWCAVGVPDAPEASFSSSLTTICETMSIQFTDQSTNTPSSWTWSFPGGTPSSSNAQNPTITYNAAGNYNVSLTVSNSGGSDAETVNSMITVNPIPAAPVVTYSLGVLESNYSSGNQWYGASGLISGATGQTYVPTDNGFYYATYVDANGCVSEPSGSVLVNASVEELYFETLSVFPNPIGNLFSVTWSGDAQVTDYRIVDVTGRVLMNGKVTENGMLTVNTELLSSGTYILELLTDKGTVNKTLVK